MHARTSLKSIGPLAFVLMGAAASWGASSPAAAQEAGGEDAKEEDDGLPLEAGRTLAVDMTVGSWISLDVSPDGGTIVFDHLGDLFTVPIGGGRRDSDHLRDGVRRPAPLLAGRVAGRLHLRPERRPERLDRVDRRRGHGAGHGGRLQPRRVSRLDAGRPVRRRGQGRLPGKRTAQAVASPCGRRVGRAAGRRAGQPQDGGSAFGPDGRWVWHSRRTGDWTYNAQLPQYQLAVYDRETGRSYARSSRYGSGMRPTLSPDGRWLVYGTRHDGETGLRLRELASGDERWLAYPVQHDDQESRGTLDLLPGMSSLPIPATCWPAGAARYGSWTSRATASRTCPSGFATTWSSVRRWSSTTPSRTRPPSRFGRSATRRPLPTATGSSSRRWTGSGSPRPTAPGPGASRTRTCPSTTPLGPPTASGSPTRRGTGTPATSGRCAPTAATRCGLRSRPRCT